MALSGMLRIHFMQQWFGYSDLGMEEALHEVPLLRRFAGLDAYVDVMPDESSICPMILSCRQNRHASSFNQ
jgi:IS5 family transposase